MNVSNAMRDFGHALRRKSPEILTGIGVAGFFTATVLAVQATVKAVDIIKDEKHKKKMESGKTDSGKISYKKMQKGDANLTKKEVVKAVWKCYIPTGVTLIASSACVIGSTSIQGRRNAALATAYSLSESALKAYTEKVIETIGEKKEKQIRGAIAQDEVTARGPVAENGIIFATNSGTQQSEIYDKFSHLTFYSSIPHLEKIRNELNARILQEHFISVNEFYDELNLPHHEMGDDLGWHVEDGLIDIGFDVALQDDRAIIVMRFNSKPRYIH